MMQLVEKQMFVECGVVKRPHSVMACYIGVYTISVRCAVYFQNFLQLRYPSGSIKTYIGR